MDRLEEMIREHKRIRRDLLILCIKSVLCAYSMFRAAMSDGKKSESYKDYLEIKDWLWKNVEKDKAEIRRILGEEWREFSFHWRLRLTLSYCRARNKLKEILGG